MRTLGVDLAAQDKDTATCTVEWRDGRALVDAPRVAPSESEILAAMTGAHAVGIDAPFGWPKAMVDAVSGWAAGEGWPADAKSDALRHRVTDRFVHDVVARERGVSVWPLSVSSDRIAVCAWRCARLLTAYRDRRGVHEAYPAASLAIWGLPHKGYKSSTAAGAAAARAKREQILDELESQARWLELADPVREHVLANDDAFDAFVCALIARAAATGATFQPPEPIGREGWIELPKPASLAQLA